MAAHARAGDEADGAAGAAGAESRTCQLRASPQEEEEALDRNFVAWECRKYHDASGGKTEGRGALKGE